MKSVRGFFPINFQSENFYVILVIFALLSASPLLSAFFAVFFALVIHSCWIPEFQAVFMIFVGPLILPFFERFSDLQNSL